MYNVYLCKEQINLTVFSQWRYIMQHWSDCTRGEGREREGHKDITWDIFSGKPSHFLSIGSEDPPLPPLGVKNVKIQENSEKIRGPPGDP